MEFPDADLKIGCPREMATLSKGLFFKTRSVKEMFAKGNDILKSIGNVKLVKTILQFNIIGKRYGVGKYLKPNNV